MFDVDEAPPEEDEALPRDPLDPVPEDAWEIGEAEWRAQCAAEDAPGAPRRSLPRWTRPTRCWRSCRWR